MKYIFLLFIIAFELSGGILKSPLVSVDNEKGIATIKVDKIDKGMSGFIVHHISAEHSSILKSAEVIAYDSQNKIATLSLSEYNGLRNNALPTGQWQVSVGDSALFAFGYTRALLIAPSEELYYKITRAVKIQWIHPDIFATILSFRGHPTPLKSDFTAMSIANSVGLLFLYLDSNVFMLDIKSMKILTINDASYAQKSVHLPFYTRVEHIESNWFGDGNDDLEAYEPHYYELLVENNKRDERLQKIIKEGRPELRYLLEKFELGK